MAQRQFSKHHRVLIRDSGEVLYSGTDEAKAHRIACANSERGVLKEYKHLSYELTKAYNGYDPETFINFKPFRLPA